jgi:hypothetical protein
MLSHTKLKIQYYFYQKKLRKINYNEEKVEIPSKKCLYFVYKIYT